jgi:hypothetical protein
MLSSGTVVLLPSLKNTFNRFGDSSYPRLLPPCPRDGDEKRKIPSRTAYFFIVTGFSG